MSAVPRVKARPTLIPMACRCVTTFVMPCGKFVVLAKNTLFEWPPSQYYSKRIPTGPRLV